jgi:hypothetical protein
MVRRSEVFLNKPEYDGWERLARKAIGANSGTEDSNTDKVPDGVYKITGLCIEPIYSPVFNNSLNIVRREAKEKDPEIGIVDRSFIHLNLTLEGNNGKTYTVEQECHSSLMDVVEKELIGKQIYVSNGELHVYGASCNISKDKSIVDPKNPRNLLFSPFTEDDSNHPFFSCLYPPVSVVPPGKYTISNIYDRIVVNAPNKQKWHVVELTLKRHPNNENSEITDDVRLYLHFESTDAAAKDRVLRFLNMRLECTPLELKRPLPIMLRMNGDTIDTLLEILAGGETPLMQPGHLYVIDDVSFLKEEIVLLYHDIDDHSAVISDTANCAPVSKSNSFLSFLYQDAAELEKKINEINSRTPISKKMKIARIETYQNTNQKEPLPAYTLARTYALAQMFFKRMEPDNDGAYSDTKNRKVFTVKCNVYDGILNYRSYSISYDEDSVFTSSDVFELKTIDLDDKDKIAHLITESKEYLKPKIRKWQ